jgi:PilZ domain-containing protein
MGMDQSSATHNRKSRRSPVLLTASILVEGALIPVKLRNLSEEGALIESDVLPAEGAATHFRRNDLWLSGRIVWVQGKYAGLAFDAPMKAEQALRHVPQPKPKAQTEFRRPGFACRPLSAHDRQMLETWMATAQIGLIDD